ncbi:MAG: hypothetical protein Q4E05_06855, partial [Pseudoclavibacter sp.]|nr:hypothetical protein [Pseudoclavibacter sp.]
PAWGEEPEAGEAESFRASGDEEPGAGEEWELETAEWEPEIGDTWPPEAVASAPWRPPEGPVEEFLEDESDPVEDGSVDFESAGDAAAAAQDALVEEAGAVEDLGFVEAGDPATESVGVHAVPPPRGSSEEEPATRTDRLATCVIRADDPFPPVTEALPVATTSLPRARPGQFPGGRSGRFPQEPTRHEPTPDPSGAAASAAATSVQE